MSNSNNIDYYVRRDNNLIANKLNNVYHKLVSMIILLLMKKMKSFKNFLNRE